MIFIFQEMMLRYLRCSVKCIVVTMKKIAYRGRMAEPKNPLGPSGRIVADNVKRLRGDLQYVKLAERLAGIGRPIPTLGLRKIESYERRVDVDDLVALAVALGVSPITLLMPYTAAMDDEAAATGLGHSTARELWQWLTAAAPIGINGAGAVLTFLRDALPPWAWSDMSEQIDAMLTATIMHPTKPIFDDFRGGEPDGDS